MKTSKHSKELINKWIADGKKSLFTYKDEDYDYSKLYHMIRKYKSYKRSNETDWELFTVEKEDKPALLLAFQDSCRNNYDKNWFHNNADWIDNFSFFPTSPKAYKNWESKLCFHYGFYRQYLDARDEIIRNIKSELEALQSLRNTAADIIVTGWSLGGSIAPIACEDIYHQTSIKPTLITFEGAAVCASRHTRNHISSIVKEDSICFVNGRDIVPRVPTFPFGWKLKQFLYVMHDSETKISKIPFYHAFLWIKDIVKNTPKYHSWTVEENLKALKARKSNDK